MKLKHLFWHKNIEKHTRGFHNVFFMNIFKTWLSILCKILIHAFQLEVSIHCCIWLACIYFSIIANMFITDVRLYFLLHFNIRMNLIMLKLVGEHCLFSTLQEFT